MQTTATTTKGLTITGKAYQGADIPHPKHRDQARAAGIQWVIYDGTDKCHAVAASEWPRLTAEDKAATDAIMQSKSVVEMVSYHASLNKIERAMHADR